MSKEKRWSGIPYEKMEENVEYAISINPADEWQYWNAEDRLETYLKCHKNYLRRLAILGNVHVCQFNLYLEISQNGRLHYHGKLKVFSKKLFYIYVIHKLQIRYTYEIDVINDADKWHEYCTKQDLMLHPVEYGFDFKKMQKDFYTVKQNNMIDKE